jgi:hypothetical protein
MRKSPFPSLKTTALACLATLSLRPFSAAAQESPKPSNTTGTSSGPISASDVIIYATGSDPFSTGKLLRPLTTAGGFYGQQVRSSCCVCTVG